ncbi:putative reverse transcriptase domain-containing protein [Tanacetum coccineum]|uniref:Reverse transcriptase domain-containing protein n=1 Tax=Tanacetum coccineum TaxID=301880 RepID=A0ABQ4WVY8_9ASTR
MPPRRIKRSAIEQLIIDRVTEAMAAALTQHEENRANNVGGGGGNAGGGRGNAGGAGGNARRARRNARGASENAEGNTISKCADEDRVKYVECTLHGRALTWWNGNKMKQELWNLIIKGDDIDGYTDHFHELALMCPFLVTPKYKKIERYIWGLPERVKGNVTSSKPANIHEAVSMARGLVDQVKVGHQTRNCRVKTPATGGNTQQTIMCFGCGENRHYKNKCPKRKDHQNEGAQGRTYVTRTEESQQDPNVVTGTFLLNNHYASILFDSGADKSFVSTTFSTLIDNVPSTLDTSYEVELANGKVVSTNTVLRGCTLNLLNHLFKIDLLPIELGSFDVVIRMDWLSEHRAVIMCGDKIVHIPYNNKTLTIEGDRSKFRLSVISCIKAQKYIERGCQLFLAHVTKKKSTEKRLEDVPIVRDFPEVFPKDLPGIPPTHQAEFQIDLVPGETPVVCAPYWLAMSEMKELAEQLQELSDKGFIRPSSSLWGAPEDVDGKEIECLELIAPIKLNEELNELVELKDKNKCLEVTNNFASEKYEIENKNKRIGLSSLVHGGEIIDGANSYDRNKSNERSSANKQESVSSKDLKESNNNDLNIKLLVNEKATTREFLSGHSKMLEEETLNVADQKEKKESSVKGNKMFPNESCWEDEDKDLNVFVNDFDVHDIDTKVLICENEFFANKKLSDLEMVKPGIEVQMELNDVDATNNEEEKNMSRKMQLEYGKWKFDVWRWPNRKKKWEETCYGVYLFSPACFEYLQPGIVSLEQWTTRSWELKKGCKFKPVLLETEAQKLKLRN